MTEPRKIQVFLSHASEDGEALAAELAGQLRGWGFDVWLDTQRLKAADGLTAEIESALQRSELGLVILTPGAIASRWVGRELEALKNLGRKTFFILDGVTVEEVNRERPLLLDDKVTLDTGKGRRALLEDLRAAIFDPTQNYILVAGSGNVEFLLELAQSLEIDQKHEVDSQTLFGGSGVNYSMRLMSYGLPVIPIPWVGDDLWGERIRTELVKLAQRQYGQAKLVDTFLCSEGFSAGETTQTSTIVIEAGKRTIFTERAEPGQRGLSFLEQRLDQLEDLGVLDQVKVVVIGHIHADRPEAENGRCTRHLIDRFADRAAVFVNFGGSQIQHGFDFWEPQLSKLAVLQLNLEEIKRLFGPREPSLEQIINTLRDSGITSVITLDRLGAVCTYAGEHQQIFALPLRISKSRLKDTTGAGDAFGSCVVAHLHRAGLRNSLGFQSYHLFEEAVEEARFWAAYACEHLGGANECPGPADFREWKERFVSRLNEKGHMIGSERRESRSMLYLLDRAYSPVH